MEECEGHILIGSNYCQPWIRDCTEGGEEKMGQTVGVIICMINSSPDKWLLRYNFIMQIDDTSNFKLPSRHGQGNILNQYLNSVW